METGSEPQRIAVIKPCCLGDCIMALPALDALAAAYPSATIDVYVGRHSMAAFQFRPQLTTVPIPDIQSAASALELSRRLRQRRYDIVVCLDRSRWLRLATALSRSNVTATVRRMKPEIRHEADVYLDVVRDLGIPTPSLMPAITASDEAHRGAIDRIAGIVGPFAVVHPGGAQNPGSTMLDKRWSPDRYVALLRVLANDGITALLSGSAGERDLCCSIAQQAGCPDDAVLAGQVDLPTLAAVIERAALYVGPDTGVSHMAAAVGTPTVAIFGPTNPRRYRPLGPAVRIAAPAESWGIPDRDLRRQATATAPTTSEVSVDSVVTACRELLSTSGSRCQP
jgi:heptosyltransferase-2/heptosyltransferase-3